MKKNNKENLVLFKRIIFILIIVLLISSLILNIIFFTKSSKVSDVKELDENIVFFGDSITEQYELEKYYPKRNIINSGISGNRSEALIERLDKDVYKFNPSKVFILIGINDLCGHIEEEDILFNIQTVINGIKSNRKNATVYIESIYPLNYKMLEEKDHPYCRDIDNSKIQRINKKIKKIAKESNIEYIDVYNKLTDGEGKLKDMYTVEGLHLNNLGYLKVTSVLNKYIEE